MAVRDSSKNWPTTPQAPQQHNQGPIWSQAWRDSKWMSDIPLQGLFVCLFVCGFWSIGPLPGSKEGAGPTVLSMLDHSLSWFSVFYFMFWCCHGSVACVLCFDSSPSCVLSVSPVFFLMCFPLLCMFVSPCLPVLFPLWFPFIISPAAPPHLFLVSSLVSVYLVSAFALCEFVASVCCCWVLCFSACGDFCFFPMFCYFPFFSFY